jgi:hypothetical protein
MNFPTNVPLRYPYVRTVRVASQVLEFLDGSEQRWQATKPLNGFEISLQDLSWADLQAVRDWFASIKGAFQEFDFVISSETFPGMVLESDVLSMTEDQKPGLFSVSFAMRQTKTSGAWPTVPPYYPVIGSCVELITQRPFTAARAFHTVRSDLPSGPRYAFAERDTERLSWVCSYPTITTAEVLTLLKFVVAMGGRTKHFQFKDPETTLVYTNCRLNNEAVQVQYSGPNECALVLSVVDVS